MTAVATAVTGALLVLYVLFAYPLLLAALAHLFPRPVRRGPYTPRISVVLAVHNGEQFLAAKLNSLLQSAYPREKLEVLVVSDGSTDATESIAKSYQDRGVTLLRVPRGGKASALNAGIAHATGDVLVFTDVRQLIHPGSLGYLAECLADPEVGVVSGELVLGASDHEGKTNVSLYWRYELWVRKQLSRLGSMEGATGALYAMRRELTVPLPPGTLLDDMYLPLAALFQGYRIVLEDRALAYDAPDALHTEFFRKVRTLAGNYQILGAYPKLLWPGSPIWIHFMSHKFGRLILPLALLSIAGASPWLPTPWAYFLLGGQGVFYGLAVLDPLFPSDSAAKRISSLCRTFCVLMLAALCALSYFFVSPHKLWRAKSRKENEAGA